MTFFICELSYMPLSGIVCIFIFGVIQANFNQHNLSESARDKIDDFLEMFSYISEGMIFIYLGLGIGDYSYLNTH